MADACADIQLFRLPKNCGKGAAVKYGLREALKQSYSHVLQIDADGQHATTDVTLFLEHGQQYPQSIICGCPIYDKSVPRIRYYARYLTHIWVWINTLSFAIKDSMWGFRVYPTQEVVALLDRQSIGDRMEFDTEIMVRWSWSAGTVINLPTRVHYPFDGISHFALWRDNVLISRMHARLFFGMMFRSPRLLLHKVIGGK